VVSDNDGCNVTDITGNLDSVTNVCDLAVYPDGTVLTGVYGTKANLSVFALRQTTGNGTWINPS